MNLIANLEANSVAFKEILTKILNQNRSLVDF